MTISPETTPAELFHNHIISTRTYNTCVQMGFNTVEHISNYYNANAGSFMSIHGCGRRTELELCTILDKLRNSIEPIDQFDVEDAPVREVFSDLYQQYINDLSVEAPLVRTFRSTFPTASALFNAAVFNADKLLSLPQTHDNRVLYLLRSDIVEILAKIIDRLAAELPEDHQRLAEIRITAETARQTLDSKYQSDYCRYKLNLWRRRYLELRYAQLVEEAPAIARNLAHTFIKTFYELVPLIYHDKGHFIRHFGGKRKSAQYFYDYVRTPFLSIFRQMLYGTVDEAYLEVYTQFPFLQEDDIKYAQGFNATHGYYPMFYIAYQFLHNSPERHHKIFCMRHGINEQHKSYTLSEIGEALDLTGERVRQIIVHLDMSDIPLMTSAMWLKYLRSDFILLTDTSDLVARICATENVTLSFDAFAHICALAFNLRYCDEFEHPFCATTKHYIAVYQVFEKLTELKKAQYPTDAVLHLNELFPRSIMALQGMQRAIIDIICPTLGIETCNDEAVFLPQSFVDIEAQAADILRAEGKPMHIDRIVETLQANNAEFDLSSDRIKNKIRLSETFRPIGKTGMYKLTEWHDVFDGTIRDLVRKILTERPTPISLDELTPMVTAIFSDTNKWSVSTSLQLSDEFIYFSTGEFGLRAKTYPPEYVEMGLSRSRLPFDERFTQFKEFVATNARIPYCSGDEAEDTLSRWYYNVLNHYIDASPEQIDSLIAFLATVKHLPQNGAEARFQKLCSQYLAFVNDHRRLPTVTDDPSLYNWIRKAMRSQGDYTDNRRVFLADLIEQLESQGFIV